MPAPRHVGSGSVWGGTRSGSRIRKKAGALPLPEFLRMRLRASLLNGPATRTLLTWDFALWRG